MCLLDGHQITLLHTKPLTQAVGSGNGGLEEDLPTACAGLIVYVGQSDITDMGDSLSLN